MIRIFAIVCAILLGGCSQSTPAVSTHTHGPKGPSILDEPLQGKEVQDRIAKAERDLPNDSCKTNTGPMAQRWNDSRRQRERKISNELLNELKPKLGQIAVPQLVDSIKAWPTNGPSQV